MSIPDSNLLQKDHRIPQDTLRHRWVKWPNFIGPAGRKRFCVHCGIIETTRAGLGMYPISSYVRGPNDFGVQPRVPECAPVFGKLRLTVDGYQFTITKPKASK